MHGLFNASLDEQCRVSHGETKTKLRYDELENYLQKNSSHPDLVYSVDFTSKRKNTLSEFRKHRSTYNNKNRRKVVAAEVTRNYLTRQRSSSIDERLSEASLNRKRKQTRRSRSMEDLLDNVTVNQLYVDIKAAYETVPDNLQKKQKPRPKKPPRLFYESYRAQNSFQEMYSPRDGGMTVSTNTLYGPVKCENEYARITDLPEVVAQKLINQKRSMPSTATLLDMCFMKQNPADQRNSLIISNMDALSTPLTPGVVSNYKTCHYHTPLLKGEKGGDTEHYHNMGMKRNFSSQFPSFRRSSVSGSSGGVYAKIPDLVTNGDNAGFNEADRR